MIDFTDKEIFDGKYKVLSKVGKGAFGEVWKVKNNEDGNFYAAKFEKKVQDQNVS